MIQENALKLAQSLIQTQEKHPDYERVTDLAKDYKTLITGKNISRLLIRYVPREDAALFEQRIRITQAVTPAIASSLMKPFNKVIRNEKTKIRHDFKDPTKNKQVTEMIKGFYGSKMKDDRGLQYWFNMRFPYLSFYDPNSWIVTEWEGVEANETIAPHPFEVPSCDAWLWKYHKEDLKWLWVHQDIKVEYLQNDGTIKKQEGHKYTLYEEENTIVLCQVCPLKLKRDGIIISDNISSGPILWEYDKKTFLVEAFVPKLGYVPASRIGYVHDGYTDGRTFVNGFHEAMPFFMKSVKTVSEQDLSMTQHAFPQKLQYVERCQGESKTKKCHQGYVAGTTQQCASCKGTGFKYHTSAQDAIFLPMPESKEEMFDLNNLLVYKTPPVELLRFQQEYTKQLGLDAHLSVFNSQMFLQSSIAKTATEVDTNMQGIYDALEPFTEKISELWKGFVHTFAKLANVSDPTEGEIIHRFPADFKMKTIELLMAEMKAANESGAPSFLRDSISMDMANIIYAGDDLGYLKYTVKHKFFPFNGKSPDEIAILLSSPYVSEFTKVLYSNFESIFTDIEIENPGFWMIKSYSRQWDIVEAKVQEYMDEINSGQPTIDFSSTEGGGLFGANDEDATDSEGNQSDSGDQSQPNQDNTINQPIIVEETIQ